MNEPLFSLNKSAQCYSLKLLSSDSVDTRDFFSRHFTRRDSRLGLPVFYDRVNQTPEGLVYNFSMRELAEAFLDKYSAERFAKYLGENSVESEQQQEVIKDIENIPNGYHYAYAIRSSGSAGRFSFWQLYVPGFTFDQLKKIIPNRYQSRSEKSLRVMKAGFSPLLVQGGQNDFGDLLMKVVDQTYVSERDYFLLKRSIARDEYFLDHLKDVSDIDRVAYYFFRKWIQPVIFFDNTFQWQAGDFDGVKVTITYKGGQKRTETFEQYELQEDHVFDMYPVLREHEKKRGDEYPLPDSETAFTNQKRHQILSNGSERQKLEDMLKGTVNLSQGKIIDHLVEQEAL